MRLRHRIVAAVAIPAVFGIGCGGGNDDEKPSVDDLALRSALDDWKGKLLKRCSIPDAFPMLIDGTDHREREQEEPGLGLLVDANVLAAKTGGRYGIEAASGEFAWFGAPTAPTGLFVSAKSRQSSFAVSQGGETKTSSSGYDVRLERSGTSCRVFFNGEQVHETSLYVTVPVVAHANAEKLANLPPLRPQALKIYSSKPESGPQTFVFAEGLFTAFNEAVHPDTSTAGFVASFFGLPVEQATRVFPLSSPTELTTTLEVTAPAVLTPTPGNTASTLLMGPSSSLGSLGNAGFHAIELILLARAPQRTTVAETSQDALAARATLLVDVQTPTSDDRLYVPRLTSLVAAPARAPSNASAAECLQDRLAMGKIYVADVAQEGEFTLSPSLNFVKTGCMLYAADWVGVSLEDVRTRRSFVEHMETRAPFIDNLSYDYLGWDEWLVSATKRAVSAGLDLAATFTPNATSKVSLFLTETALRLAEVPDAELRTQHRDTLVDLSARWTFHISPPLEFRSRVVQAINQHGRSLERSLRTLLAEAMKSQLAAEPLVRCAASFDDARVKQFRELRAAANGSGVSEAVASREEVLFSICPSSETLAAWGATVHALKAFEAEELQRSPSIFFGGEFQELSERALTEGWTSQTLETLVKVSTLVPLVEVLCGSYSTFTEKAGCRDEAFSAADGRVLAPVYQGRYGTLADQLAPHLEAMQSKSFTVSYELGRALLGESLLWGTCDAAAFHARSAELVDAVSKVAASKPGLQSLPLDRKVQELLDTGC